MGNSQQNLIRAHLWPKSIQQHIKMAEAKFSIVEHNRTHSLLEAADSSGVSQQCLIRSVILKDSQGLIMAVMPADRLLDFSALSKTLNRDLQLVSDEELSKIFRDCEPGSYPPISEVYQIDAIIDKEVYKLPELYFEPGAHQLLLKMDQAEFQKLNSKAKIESFTETVNSLSIASNTEQEFKNVVTKFTPVRTENSVEELAELPSLPKLAGALLKLRTDSNLTGKKMAKVIEQDPKLAAQFMLWACSSYYGGRGNIESIEAAITEVFGLELAMNIALGIVVAKSMQASIDGPLGLKAYWKFSVYVASLVEELAKQMPADIQPNRVTAYLAGFLHNFGQLVLGKVFPSQFFLLNRYKMANPNVQVTQIEKRVLGVGHEQIGAWLLRTWGLPEEVVAAARWHHQGEFLNQYAIFPNLVLIATRLLKQHDMGDAESTELPAAVLEHLHITKSQAQKAYEKIMKNSSELDVPIIL